MEYAGAVSPRPFGLRDKLGYMFGDFGNDFTFILSYSFMMVVYTNVMGISHLGVKLATWKIRYTVPCDMAV